MAEAVLASGNNGLTFIWVPQLFDLMPLGRIFKGVVPFLAADLLHLATRAGAVEVHADLRPLADLLR